MIVFGVFMQFSPRQVDLLEARLAQFTEAGRAPTTLSEVEMSLPFFERAIRPVLDRFGGYLSKRAQAGSQQVLQEKLNLAGRPWGLTAQDFHAVRLLSLILCSCLGLAVSLLLGFTMPMWLIGPFGGGGLGYLLPESIVSRRIRKRKKGILLSLPSALDLLTI